MRVAGEDTEKEGFGRVVQKLAALFYANDVLLVSSCLTMLQEAMDILAGLFSRLSLQTNVANTVVMLYQPFRSMGSQSMLTYTSKMTVEGRNYR